MHLSLLIIIHEFPLPNECKPVTVIFFKFIYFRLKYTFLKILFSRTSLYNPQTLSLVLTKISSLSIHPSLTLFLFLPSSPYSPSQPFIPVHFFPPKTLSTSFPLSHLLLILTLSAIPDATPEEQFILKHTFSPTLWILK